MDCLPLDLVDLERMLVCLDLVDISQLVLEKSTLTSLMMVLEILIMAWEILTLRIMGRSSFLWKIVLETLLFEKLGRLTLWNWTTGLNSMFGLLFLFPPSHPPQCASQSSA